MDSCIEQILEQLLPGKYQIIVRPHPQYVRHYPEKLDALQLKYTRFDNFTLQTDFSSNETVFDSDVLITDWSGTAYEYSFTTLKPCLFINTPMKIMNPDYKDIGIVPFDIEVRNQLGIALELSDLANTGNAIERLMENQLFSEESIRNLREKYLYNIGNSASVGADYLIKQLIKKSVGN